MRARRWRALPLAVLAVLAVLFAGCTNSSPPPVVDSPVSQATRPKPADPSRIVVGVRSVAGGYNPHLLADSSSVTSALATLLLPSVFRETGTGDSAERTLQSNVMSSAEVSSTDPFTVSYVIRQDASWSDGAPIAAEDFIYLAHAMQTRPGVVNPAGYRLIDDIRSSHGGKHVEVEFAEPYPGWRTLFDNLLPAHLLKDTPGGWPKALDDEFPAYGGAFAIKSRDMARGEIVLQRNERYWGDPAKVDQIVLRRTDQQDMAAALRNGTIQLALSGTDRTGLRLLRQLGNRVQLHTLPRERLATVLLNPRSPQLSRSTVRSAVAALIDRQALSEIGTGGGSSAQLDADAQVRAPSAPGYEPTIRSGGVLTEQRPDQAAALLRKAGFTHKNGMWRKNGSTLTLVIATPGNRKPYDRIGEALAGQLAAAGIDVRTTHPKPRPLFGEPLAGPRPGESGDDTSDQGSGTADKRTESRVDLAVVPQETGSDAATVLASRFGCGAVDADSANAERAVRASAAAYCDSDIQPLIRKVLTGQKSVSDAVAAIEPQLWKSHISIPLFQLSDTLAVGRGIEGVELDDSGTGSVNPFASAANWRRVRE